MANSRTQRRCLGVALVGCGDYSEQHVQGCLHAQHARLVKVMDVNAQAAERYRQAYQVPATTSYQEVLDDPAVDIVIIAVPHYLHKSLTVQAARAGKHVLCEKPIATTVADARAMIRVCQEHKVKLCIGFGQRRGRLIQKAKELLAQGVIGDLMLVTVPSSFAKKESYWHEGYRHVVTTDWRGSKRKSGGGFFIMNIIHTLDMLRFVTGLEYTRVWGSVRTARTPVEVEDLGCAVLHLSNGAYVSVAGGTILPAKKEERVPVTLYGTAGRMEVGWPTRVFTTKKVKGFKRGDWTELAWPHRHPQRRRGWTPLIEQLALAVIHNTAPPITGHDGLQALRAVLGIYQSSRTGRMVSVR